MHNFLMFAEHHYYLTAVLQILVLVGTIEDVLIKRINSKPGTMYFQGYLFIIVLKFMELETYSTILLLVLWFIGAKIDA